MMSAAEEVIAADAAEATVADVTAEEAEDKL